MARSTGKNIANTGMRIVPNPKPEKNVSSEVIKAARLRTTISVIEFSVNRPPSASFDKKEYSPSNRVYCVH
jgi:hypothetical protein